jgi:hypothetical protein
MNENSASAPPATSQRRSTAASSGRNANTGNRYRSWTRVGRMKNARLR